MNVRDGSSDYASNVTISFPAKWFEMIKLYPLTKLLRRESLTQFSDGTPKLSRYSEEESSVSVAFEFPALKPFTREIASFNFLNI